MQFTDVDLPVNVAIGIGAYGIFEFIAGVGAIVTTWILHSAADAEHIPGGDPGDIVATEVNGLRSKQARKTTPNRAGFGNDVEGLFNGGCGEDAIPCRIQAFACDA